MLLRSLRLRNLLSFGPGSEALELRPLNVLIGPNGSGKSNLIEVLSLLRAAPDEIANPIREGGGMHQWLWRGQSETTAGEVEVLVSIPEEGRSIRYHLALVEENLRPSVFGERIEEAGPGDSSEPRLFFESRRGGRPRIRVGGDPRELEPKDLHPGRSILAQRKDPDLYPEITRLGEWLEDVRIFRDWSMGRRTPARMPQPADLPNDSWSRMAETSAWCSIGSGAGPWSSVGCWSTWETSTRASRTSTSRSKGARSSDILVDALSEDPESVVVCEKLDGATVMRRLSREELGPWLEDYTLGNLWTRGDLGGNRW